MFEKVMSVVALLFVFVMLDTCTSDEITFVCRELDSAGQLKRDETTVRYNSTLTHRILVLGFLAFNREPLKKEPELRFFAEGNNFVQASINENLIYRRDIDKTTGDYRLSMIETGGKKPEVTLLTRGKCTRH